MVFASVNIAAISWQQCFLVFGKTLLLTHFIFDRTPVGWARE